MVLGRALARRLGGVVLIGLGVAVVFAAGLAARAMRSGPSSPVAGEPPAAGSSARQIGVRAERGKISPPAFEGEDGRDLLPGAGVRRGPRTGVPRLVLVTDYQCGACAATDAVLGDSLFAWAAAGRLRLLLIPAPLPGHRRGRTAAAVARCAGRLGRFEAVHAAIFRERRRWIQRPGSLEALISIASAEGIERTALRRCLESDDTGALLRADSVAASRIASVRPTLYLDGSRLRASEPRDLLPFLRLRLASSRLEPDPPLESKRSTGPD